MIKNLISKIRGRQWEGSSTSDGKLYHNLPFEGFSNFKSHRGKTELRWSQISKYMSKGKTVLDLGCNVGAFSILASMVGASKVVGIDHDEQSIDIARYVASKVGAKNIEFRCQEINSDIVDELGEFDITLWLSQWAWVIKQLGIDKARSLLYKMSKKSDLMIFESAANDGNAGIKGMTQEKVESLFRDSTCYSKIRNIGNSPGWYDRNVLVGKQGISRWKGMTSQIKRLDYNMIRKIFRQDYRWMINRSAEALERLNRYENFPKLIRKGRNYLYLTYCGNRLEKFDREQCLRILSALKECRIVHRDITPNNLLTKEGIVYLIDFGWCLFDGEKESPVKPPETLGLHYYKNGVWDDEKAMNIISSEMNGR